MLTAEELRQIHRLQLQAGRRVDSLFSGDYRSAFRGRGMEFEEVRAYVPGDDIRHIDWNVTARTGAPFVKEFREERQLTICIALDVSGSVRFGSGGRDGRTSKALQQARIGAALAHLATKSNDRVGLVSFTDEVDTYLPPRRSRGHAWQVVRTVFEHKTAQGQTDLVSAIEFLGRVLKRRAVVCFVSDFLDDGAWAQALAPFARRHRVNAFVVHDPRESELPRLGLMEFIDAETGALRLVDTSAAQAHSAVSTRLERLRRMGVAATAIATNDDPFERMLEHFRRSGRSR